MAKKLDKLKELGMPKKPMAEEEAELDLGMELGLEEEGMGEEMGEDEMGMEELEGSEMFEEIDDEMLIEEMKKRGLSIEEEDMEAEEVDPEDFSEDDL